METTAGLLDAQMLRALIWTETFQTWTALFTAMKHIMQPTTIWWKSHSWTIQMCV